MPVSSFYGDSGPASGDLGLAAWYLQQVQIIYDSLLSTNEDLQALITQGNELVNEAQLAANQATEAAAAAQTVLDALIAQLNLDIATDAAAVGYTPADLSDWNGSADPGDTNDALDQLADRIKALEGKQTEFFQIVLSDPGVTIATGTKVATWRAPYAFTVTDVRASLKTAQTSGSDIELDINDNGVSILSTPLKIDNGEKTSVTAVIAPVISDTTIADDGELSIDIVACGAGGDTLVVCIIGHKT